MDEEKTRNDRGAAAVDALLANIKNGDALHMFEMLRETPGGAAVDASTFRALCGVAADEIARARRVAAKVRMPGGMLRLSVGAALARFGDGIAMHDAPTTIYSIVEDDSGTGVWVPVYNTRLRCNAYEFVPYAQPGAQDFHVLTPPSVTKQSTCTSAAPPAIAECEQCGRVRPKTCADCAPDNTPGQFHRDKAASELRDALEFFDRVNRAPEAEQIAVGRDHWTRLVEAVRASVKAHDTKGK